MAALIDKSLIRQTGDGAEPRFAMLETIREYALERLQASGELAASQAQHAAYFLALAEEADLHLQGAGQISSLDRLEADNDNLRATLSWYARTPGAEDRELRLLSALGNFWIIRGYMGEGRMWMESALERSQTTISAARAYVLNMAGIFQNDLGRMWSLCAESLRVGRIVGDKRSIAWALHNHACLTKDIDLKRQWFAQSLALFREIDDTWGTCWSLIEQAAMEGASGDAVRAAARSDEALSIARNAGDPWLITEALNGGAGMIAWMRGDYARALVLLTESLELGRDARNRVGIANTLFMLAHVARALGDDPYAADCYDECLMLARDMGDQRLVAQVQHNRTFIALHQGDITRATACVTESLAICRATADEHQMAWSLAALAGVVVAKGEAERAAWLLGAAEAHFKAINQWVGPIEQAEHAGYANAARALLGEVAFEAAWAAGAATPVAQSTTRVLDEAVPGVQNQARFLGNAEH